MDEYSSAPDPDVVRSAAASPGPDAAAPAAPAPPPAAAAPTPAPVVVAPTAPMVRQEAGFGLVWVGLGAAGGAALGGAWGALSGAALVGAIRNGARAAAGWRRGDGSSEIRRSATVAVVGLGVAAFGAYSAAKKKEDEE